MTMLDEWARTWAVSDSALMDLRARMGIVPGVKLGEVDGGEAAASVRVRLESARLGITMWRNNVGALEDERGRWVRYGLCNDSKQLNEKVKSGDLIGIRPITITPQMVGYRVGQFVSREMKAPGWKYSGTPREVAQLAWADLVTSLGGDARFTTGPGSFG